MADYGDDFADDAGDEGFDEVRCPKWLPKRALRGAVGVVEEVQICPILPFVGLSR